VLEDVGQGRRCHPVHAVIEENPGTVLCLNDVRCFMGCWKIKKYYKDLLR